MRKRAYQSTSVKQVILTEVIARLAAGLLYCGLDIGKKAILCVIRDSTGYFERPWKIKNPEEIGELVKLLQAFSKRGPMQVAMESTGTYGDALRQALGDAGLEVRRVSGKAAKDYAEIFDGVPSAHDGKDAAVIAELAALGKSVAWPLPSLPAWQAQMKVEVSWLDDQQSILQHWLGQLEALLARHWPEITRLFDLDSSTLLRALAHYGSPARLAADGEAIEQLKSWGGHLLRAARVQAMFDSASTTMGVRMNDATIDHLKRVAQQAWNTKAEIRQVQRRMRELAAHDPVIQAQTPVVGELTACVLRVSVGDPREYTCGAAYRKAMGLNLKECSSGQYQGQLKITKRGSSRARRWLYFAALRWIQQSPVRGWYEGKKLEKRHGKRAVIALMRKLALALHSVATGSEPFVPERLFSKSLAAGKQRSVRSRKGTKGSIYKRSLTHSANSEVGAKGIA